MGAYELLTAVNAFKGEVLQNATQAMSFKSTILAEVRQNLAHAQVTVNIDTAAFTAFDMAKDLMLLITRLVHVPCLATRFLASFLFPGIQAKPGA